MSAITIARSLDRRGKTITTFVVFDAAVELQKMQAGETLEIATDDFAPFPSDIAAWCDAAGHKLLESVPEPGSWRFLIEKGTMPAHDKALAMVISTAGLEELLSPLGFALAAALEGMEVNLFFQGPGVRVLARGYQPKLGGWGRPFTRFAAAGMAKSGHIAAQDKLAQLRSLGAHIYMCGPSMKQFKVSVDELIFDDLPLVEYLTFMAIMRDSDVHIYS